MVQDYSSGVSNKSVYLTQTTDIFFASLSEQSPKILFTLQWRRKHMKSGEARHV